MSTFKLNDLLKKKIDDHGTPAITAPVEKPVKTNLETAGSKPNTLAALLAKAKNKPAEKTKDWNSVIQEMQATQTAPKPQAKTIGDLIKLNVAKAQFDPNAALKLLAAKGKLVSDSTKIMAVATVAELKEERGEVNLPVLALNNLPAPIDLELDNSQKTALDGLLQEQFGCLIGAAGTGKTTVTKRLIKMLEQYIPTIDYNLARASITEEQAGKPDYRLAIGFCAYTGRAVQQMKRALPTEYHHACNTVHATLGYMPEYFDILDAKTGLMKTTMRFFPTFGIDRKLPFKIIIIDEAGMLPIKLWNELMDALLPDCRVIMIGDINQLPPVQGRSVLGFAMTKWPTFELTEIWRQKIRNPDGSITTAEANPIVEAAWNVLQGKFPQKKKGQFDMLGLPDGSTGAFNSIIRVVTDLHKLNKFDPFKDALIVPQNKGNIGQLALNEKLVPYFNPPVEQDKIKLNPRTIIATGMGSINFAIGDKVMLLQNDRQRELTNGMTGVITEINVNGLYQKAIHDGRVDTNFDLEDFMSGVDAEHTAMANGDNQKSEGNGDEESNTRQASHITTVYFGPVTLEEIMEIEKLRVEIRRMDAMTTDELCNKYGNNWYYHKEGLQEQIKDRENEMKKHGQFVTFSTSGQYSKLAHAYAITCHKSQGGEYPTVIIVVHAATLRMLKQEWLYTAITRAKERCILLYNNRGMAQALKIKAIKGKTTKEKIAAFQAWVDAESRGEKVDVPNLPEPMRIVYE